MQPIETYTMDQHIDYIKDEAVKERLKKLLNEVKSFDPKKVTADAIKSAISVKASGRVIAYFESRRKNFYIYLNNTDSEWKGFPINSDEDIFNIKELLRLNFEKANLN
jgi:hypothetical protein